LSYIIYQSVNQINQSISRRRRRRCHISYINQSISHCHIPYIIYQIKSISQSKSNQSRYHIRHSSTIYQSKQVSRHRRCYISINSVHQINQS